MGTTRHRGLASAIVLLVLVGVVRLGADSSPAIDDHASVAVTKAQLAAPGAHRATGQAVPPSTPAHEVAEIEVPGARDGGAVPAATAAPLLGGPRPRAAKIPGGKGVTDDTLQVGISWIDLSGLAAATNAGFGTSYDPDGPSTIDLAKAVVAHVNSTGGIAGRQIDAVYHQVPAGDVFNAQTRRQAEQGICADFTEDHKVFVMVPLLSFEGVTTACAASTDTPMIAVANSDDSVDDRRFEEVGRWWFRPNWFAAERRERTIVDRLASQGFFTDDARVAVMVEDKPVYTRAVEAALEPALGARGIEPVVTIAYPDAINSPWDNYVLQMQTLGVTHVVWAHSPATSSPQGLTMRAAESQRWHPRWALGTEAWYGTLLSLAPPAQLEAVQGIGWSPLYDGRYKFDAPLTTSTARCITIFREAGLGDGTAGQLYCEALFFLDAALARAPAATPDGLVMGVEALGDSYVPVMTETARFEAGRHDGPNSVWDVRYDAACSCFAYVGPSHPSS